MSQYYERILTPKSRWHICLWITCLHIERTLWITFLHIERTFMNHIFAHWTDVFESHFYLLHIERTFMTVKAHYLCWNLKRDKKKIVTKWKRDKKKIVINRDKKFVTYWVGVYWFKKKLQQKLPYLNLMAMLSNRLIFELYFHSYWFVKPHLHIGFSVTRWLSSTYDDFWHLKQLLRRN